MMNLRYVILAFSLFFIGLAQATSFIEQPFSETVKEAPVLVRGKVGASYVDWGLGADGGRQIFTFYELQIDEVLKGTVSLKSITMREMGGEKDGKGMHVSGASQFSRGEDVVVMLGNRNPEGSYDVWGLMMGKVNIEQNQSGKEALSGPALVHHRDGTGGQTDPSPEPDWTLDALRDLIRRQSAEVASGVSPQNPSGPESQQRQSSVSAAATPAASGAAPQLQTSPPEEPKSPQNFGFLGWLSLALGGLGIFAIWVLLRRSRK